MQWTIDGDRMKCWVNAAISYQVGLTSEDEIMQEVVFSKLWAGSDFSSLKLVSASRLVPSRFVINPSGSGS